MSEYNDNPEVFPAKMTIENFEIQAPRVIREVEGTKTTRKLVLEIREDANLSYERKVGTRDDETPHAATLHVTLPADFNGRFMEQLASKLTKAAPKDGFQTVEAVEEAVTKAAKTILKDKCEVEKVPHEGRFSQWSHINN